MSACNTLAQKKIRRLQRSDRKRAAAKKIPHGGVVVRALDVRRHRYLRDQKLPFSETLAGVHLQGDGIGRFTDPEQVDGTIRR